MKKVFLLAAAAATVLTGCVSDGGRINNPGIVDGDPEAPMASLSIRLGGGFTTRSLEGRGDTAPGTNQIANAHVFILDETGTDVIDYAPVVGDGDLDAIKGSGWTFPDRIPVDSKVYVVGNVNADYNRTVKDLATLTQINEFTSDIWTQTDYNLATMANEDGAPVEMVTGSSGSAKVTVEIAPVISRLELHTLEGGGNIKGFSVTGVFLTNYHTAYTYGGSIPAGSQPVDNAEALATNRGMTGDDLQYPAIAQGMPLKAEMTGNRIWAYNIPAGSLPLLIVRLENVLIGSTLQAGPLYLKVSSYGTVTEFKAGKIYRIATLDFTEENLAISPNAGGNVDVDAKEWDNEDIDPDLDEPGSRVIHIVAPGGFSGTFPADATDGQTFSVNAGPMTLLTWDATIDNTTDFELTVDEENDRFTVRPLSANNTGSPRTATVTVTGTVDTSVTRAEQTFTSTYPVTQAAAGPIEPIAVSTVAITEGATSLEAGQTSTYEATVSPDGATDKTVKWSSSNTTVATINASTGELTAITAGTTQITATATNGTTDTSDDKTDTRELTVSAVITDPDPEPQGNILIFTGEGESAALGLGIWPGDFSTEPSSEDYYLKKIAYFKWGSVIGMNNADGYDTFSSTPGGDTNAVIFNPAATEVTWDTYADIPYESDETPSVAVEDQAYTSRDNVLLGKGDPCRLVGLTVAEIRAAANDLDQWNALMAASEWKMPTNAENKEFSGNHTNGAAYDDTNVTRDGSPATWSETAPGFATFRQAANAVLPAAGYRSTDGAVSRQGTYGGYWSSTRDNASNGYYLYFRGTSVYPSSGSSRSLGLAVRCVPQE